MKTTLRILGLATIVGALSLVSRASNFHGAVFYQHIDYEGSALTLYPGEGIADLSLISRSTWRSWNNEISSVAVWGEVVVYLYEHRNYGGRVVTLIDHAPDLFFTEWGNFNDRTSSIYVDWYYPQGWMYDTTLLSWTYWEGEWMYHEEGLGWVHAAYYDRTHGEGWIFDHAFGWLYTDYTRYPWFYSYTWGQIYFEHGSRNPRWWYTDYYGWFNG